MNNVFITLNLFTKQCRQAWKESQLLDFDPQYKNASTLVISGMGASCFGYYVLKTAFSSALNIPLVLANSYNLPNFVNKNTLVVIQSYSGSTEETISCLKDALERQCLLLGIGVDGEMSQILSQSHIPFYQIKPEFNPSQQPRYGLGYTIFGLLGSLNKIGLLQISDQDVEDSLNFVETQNSQIQDLAKQLVEELKNKVPLIFSAEHLSGNAHILRNQLNESAKSFADYNLLPELNHHLLEGLANPPSNRANLVVLGLHSSLYSDKIRKRFALTKDVAEKNGLKFLEVEVQGTNKLQQALWMISWGGYLSYYLAQAYQVDPIAIPWVDYFKKRLK